MVYQKGDELMHSDKMFFTELLFDEANHISSTKISHPALVIKETLSIHQLGITPLLCSEVTKSLVSA